MGWQLSKVTQDGPFIKLIQHQRQVISFNRVEWTILISQVY